MGRVKSGRQGVGKGVRVNGGRQEGGRKGICQRAGERR